MKVNVQLLAWALFAVLVLAVRDASSVKCADSVEYAEYCVTFSEECDSANPFQIEFMTEFCSATCGFCKIPMPPKCTDSGLFKTGECEKMRKVGKCRRSDWLDAMMAGCAGTCGFCEIKENEQTQGDMESTVKGSNRARSEESKKNYVRTVEN